MMSHDLVQMAYFSSSGGEAAILAWEQREIPRRISKRLFPILLVDL